MVILMTGWIRGSESRVTKDGELWSTATERENDVFCQFSASSVASTEYVVLVDRDNPVFPHKLQGQGDDRIDITSLHFAIDAAINANGIISLGTIRRIDGTNADIWQVFSIPFLATTTQFIGDLKGLPSQLKIGLSGSRLTHGITNMNEISVSPVNTGITLNSPLGASSVTPGLGDIILKVDHISGGSFNVGTFIFYHGHKI